MADTEAPKPKKPISPWWWVAGGVIALGVIGVLAGPPPEPAGNAVTAAAEVAPSPTPALAVTFDALVSAYEENELAAKRRFEGKPIEVTGKVSAITSSLGEPTVSFEGRRLNSAHFGDDATDQLAALKAGQKLTVRCDSLSEAISVLTLRGCVLVK